MRTTTAHQINKQCTKFFTPSSQTTDFATQELIVLTLWQLVSLLSDIVAPVNRRCTNTLDAAYAYARSRSVRRMSDDVLQPYINADTIELNAMRGSCSTEKSATKPSLHSL